MLTREISGLTHALVHSDTHTQSGAPLNLTHDRGYAVLDGKKGMGESPEIQ